MKKSLFLGFVSLSLSAPVVAFGQAQPRPHMMNSPIDLDINCSFEVANVTHSSTTLAPTKAEESGLRISFENIGNGSFSVYAFVNGKREWASYKPQVLNIAGEDAPGFAFEVPKVGSVFVALDSAQNSFDATVNGISGVCEGSYSAANSRFPVDNSCVLIGTSQYNCAYENIEY